MSKHLEAFLDSTKKLAEAATPGPWLVSGGTAILKPTDSMMGNLQIATIENSTRETRWHDQAFIAASRTRLPLALELLSEAIAGLKDSCVCDPGEVCPACDALKSLEAKAKESHE